jgi:hypothetical protein
MVSYDYTVKSFGRQQPSAYTHKLPFHPPFHDPALWDTPTSAVPVHVRVSKKLTVRLAIRNNGSLPRAVSVAAAGTHG